MNDTFTRQRRGYSLRLDELIRESRPEDIKLRCDSFIFLEQSSEFRYMELMILKKIFNDGLSKFESAVLNELNEKIINNFRLENDNSHYSRQRNVRNIVDKSLDYSFYFIDNWEGNISRGESEKNKNIEESYRKLMVDREIMSRGLKDSISLIYNLDSVLNDKFKDNKNYNEILDFSLKFIGDYGKNILEERNNLYLLVHENEYISIERPFPSGPLERLKKFGVVGDSLQHYFIHFPVLDYNLQDNYFSAVFPQENIDLELMMKKHDLIADIYSDNVKFPSPKIAITVIERADYIKNLFSKKMRVISLV